MSTKIKSRAVHEPLQWCGSQDGLVDEVAVLELLAQPLQGGEGLVQGDRHRDLAQVLPDVLAQQVPQVDALRLSLRDRQLSPGIKVSSRNCRQLPTCALLESDVSLVPGLRQVTGVPSPPEQTSYLLFATLKVSVPIFNTEEFLANQSSSLSDHSIHKGASFWPSGLTFWYFTW